MPTRHASWFGKADRKRYIYTYVRISELIHALFPSVFNFMPTTLQHTVFGIIPAGQSLQSPHTTPCHAMELNMNVVVVTHLGCLTPK